VLDRSEIVETEDTDCPKKLKSSSSIVSLLSTGSFELVTTNKRLAQYATKLGHSVTILTPRSLSNL
jgi:diphthamide biosynthesis methyltransferase